MWTRCLNVMIQAKRISSIYPKSYLIRSVIGLVGYLATNLVIFPLSLKYMRTLSQHLHSVKQHLVYYGKKYATLQKLSTD